MAALRCAADIALRGNPARGLGIKCQLKRSSLSNVNRALARASSSSDARKARAACAMLAVGEASAANLEAPAAKLTSSPSAKVQFLTNLRRTAIGGDSNA